MRLAFYVNDVMTEGDGYTTNQLAMAAIARGHEAWVIGADDFILEKDNTIKARARHAPRASYKSGATYLADLKGPKARIEEITVHDLDVLFLRSDPAKDTGARHWAQGVGLDFGRVAISHGVIVLNDPYALADAMNKMYFQPFPEEVRPRTIITRSREKIRRFAKEEGNWVVLKPL